MRHWFALLAVMLATVGLTACGDDNEAAPSASEQAASEDAQAAADAAEEAQKQVDELEQELAQQEQEIKQEQKEPAPAPEPEPEPEPAEPPDVVGLTLPAAKQLLKEAGYKANVSNTDAAFGILIPQNYTVCEQSPPRGDLVPILAQKDGC